MFDMHSKKKIKNIKYEKGENGFYSEGLPGPLVYRVVPFSLCKSLTLS